MKNLKIKRLISLVIVVIMIFSTTSIALATDDVVPTIVVSGMLSTSLDNNDTNETVLPPSTSIVKDSIKSNIKPLFESIFKCDFSSIVSSIPTEIRNVLDGVSCDENGESVYNVSNRKFDLSINNYADFFDNTQMYQQGVATAVGKEIGEENTYYFNYDWRMSPLDHADDLNIMVEQVKENHKCDKVNIVGLSMGGNVIASYLYKYGNDSFNTIVFGSTAFQGVALAGELLQGNFSVASKGTLDYIAELIKDVALASSAVSYTSKFLANSNFIGNIIDKYIDKVIDEIKKPMYEEILSETFASMLGIWSLVPASYYESAKEASKSYTDLSEEFYAKADEYIYNVQVKVKDLIDQAKANNVNVYIIGSYGYTGIPVSDATNLRTDMLIETKYMLGNCAVANYGETLDDLDYSKENAQVNSNYTYISTDNIIDASVGMYPNHTWVIKNMTHIEFEVGSAPSDLIVWLTTTDESVDVFSNAQYPQFVEYNRINGGFTSLTEGVEIESTNDKGIFDTIERIIELIVKALELVKTSY